MKILRVASDIYPYVLGGIGLHTHPLSLEQSNHGHEVTVITYCLKIVRSKYISCIKGCVDLFDAYKNILSYSLFLENVVMRDIHGVLSQ